LNCLPQRIDVGFAAKVVTVNIRVVNWIEGFVSRLCDLSKHIL